jgi:RNA polymerase sigma-70 factor (ECF subfamily)
MMSLAAHARPDELSPPAAPEHADAELVRATLAEPQAFAQIVQRYTRRVFNFIFQLTRQRQDAEDLTQQTFIKAYRNLHRFDCARPLINWLLTIARRTALNHFRDTQKWEIVPDDLASADPSPARSVEYEERKNNLWARARRTLAQREFEVMWLRFGEEMSIEETSRITGLTSVHVKVIVHRARQHLLKGEPRS